MLMWQGPPPGASGRGPAPPPLAVSGRGPGQLPPPDASGRGSGPPPPDAGGRGPGQPPALVEYRMYYADYRSVSGVKWPFRIRGAVAGETVEETTFDRVSINVKIDPRKFEAPK